MAYEAKEIEKKWQEIWLKNGEFEPKDDYSLPKKYIFISPNSWVNIMLNGGIFSWHSKTVKTYWV